MNDPEPKTDKTSANLPEPKENLTKRAIAILRGQEKLPAEILALAQALKNLKSFNYARRILERAVEHPEIEKNKHLKLTIYQQWALCTYKDNDLPIDLRLNDALKILAKVEDFEKTQLL